MALARGEVALCVRAGCQNPREYGSYCGPCWAAYMADYRERRKSAPQGLRKLSRETAVEEASMSNVGEHGPNGLGDNDFRAETPAGMGVSFLAPGEAGLEAARAELEDDAAAPVVRALSPAEYLAWLALETRKALRVAEDCLETGRPPQLDAGDEPMVRALPADLPPLQRRLFDVQIRLARESRDAARRLAQVLGAIGDAFDAGLNNGGQAF